MEQKFYLCEHCGNIIAMVKDKGVPVMCCGQKMTELVPGTTDAAQEKHVPVYTVEGNLVTVKVRDHGCGIADIPKAMEPLYTTGGSERAGLGFAVMQELMDEVRVTSREGTGTTVRLRRRLSQKSR